MGKEVRSAISYPNQFPNQNSPRPQRRAGHEKVGPRAKVYRGDLLGVLEHDVCTIGDYEELSRIAAALGVDPSEFVAVSDSEKIRQALIDSTNLARERGVFGAPSIIIEDELYWGKDRMDFVEDHLARLD